MIFFQIKGIPSLVNINLITWDITALAKKWNNSEANYGLMIKDAVETTGYKEYESSDSPTTVYKPQVVMEYRNNSGLEDFWSYHSQDAGRAGTGYVNDYAGNLIFVHNDLSMNGSKMPVSMNHIYNNTDKDTPSGYGNGWRLNLSQRLIYKNIDGKDYYQYIDSDGTRHYFKYDYIDKVYRDESGLDLKLIPGTGTYTIRDKKDNELTFNSSGLLESIGDNKGNIAVLSYTNTSMGLTLNKVTDGAGRVTLLNVSASGYLTSIKDPSGRITSFGYTGTKLTKITYPDGKSSIYDYDAYNNLLSATNFDGYKVVYNYYPTKPYNIKQVLETHTDGTLGQRQDIVYGDNSTTFTDAINRKFIYQFDDEGHTVGIKNDEIGASQFFSYSTKIDTTDPTKNTNNTKNKLIKESGLQNTAVNLIRNHNTESATYWYAGNDAGSIGTHSIASDNKYIGNKSLFIDKENNTGRHYYSQTVTGIEKGETYTFSGYIKTNGITATNGKGAALFITYQDSNNNQQTVYSRFINGTNDWERVEMQFTLPSTAASTAVYAAVGIYGESGGAYFDAVQMEKGLIANRYNLIENADFKYGLEYWSKNDRTDSGDTIVSQASAPKLDSNIFRINGDAKKQKAIYQQINISGSNYDSFTVGGWAKAQSVPQGAERYFALDVGFKRKSDGQFDWVVVPFNVSSTDWQYVSAKVKPEIKPAEGKVDDYYTDIYIYAIYYENVNTAYFDGIHLYKEEAWDQYDFGIDQDSGSKDINLINTTDPTGKNDKIEYNSRNEVTQITDNKGNTTYYGYYDNLNQYHNLKNIKSPEGVVNAFKYDTSGNVTTEKISDSTNELLETMYIQSTSTYKNDNYLETSTDPLGNIITYNFNALKGVLDDFTDAKGKKTSYTYDVLDRLETVSKYIGTSEIKNIYSYENDKIKTITHNGFSYTFGYDSLGNLTNVKAGGEDLVTNKYDLKTGRLLESVYGDPISGPKIGFDYDTLDRVTAKKYNGAVRHKYVYNSSGNLSKEEDLVNGVSYSYLYDTGERLVKVIDSKGNASSFSYDQNNNVTSFKEKIGGKEYTTSFEYDKDNRQNKVTISNKSDLSLQYDPLGRLETSGIKSEAGSNILTTGYKYYDGAHGVKSKTASLETITNNGISIAYSYDANGNIETITQGGNTIKYYYNELNELTKVENPALNLTTMYFYDAGGNLTSRAEYNYTTKAFIKDYLYSYNTSWKDRLESYNGKAITYDGIGNPLSYDGYTYTWEEGRQLKTIIGNSKNISYKYNSEGIRTEKTVNGVTTKYHLSGDSVTQETNGTDTIYYSYDSSNNLISMNLNGTEYYYVRNGQGDIIGLVDAAGAHRAWDSYFLA